MILSTVGLSYTCTLYFTSLFQVHSMFLCVGMGANAG